MHVLITGGAGFIGSHLAEAMLAAGERVTVLDDLSTGRKSNLAAVQGHPSFCLVEDTVRNESVTTELIRQADVVYHLAAAVGVRLIVESPVHTIETNIHGSEIVLAAAARFGKPVFLASTSEVYGKSRDVPFREDADVIYGSTACSRWSYACSKAIDEYLALAYHQEHGLPVVIGRLFNVIGPRQRGAYGMVVPRFVRAALRNEPIPIYGDGEQTRCFCHVRDVVEAIRCLMRHPRAAGAVFNIGATEEITINELARRIVELADSRSPLVHLSYEEAFGRPFDDMMRRQPDIARLSALTGWKPSISLLDALRDVVNSLRSEAQQP